jgi:hypothetical protein
MRIGVPRTWAQNLRILSHMVKFSPSAEIASDGCAARYSKLGGPEDPPYGEVRRVVGGGSPNILDTWEE